MAPDECLFEPPAVGWFHLHRKNTENKRPNRQTRFVNTPSGNTTTPDQFQHQLVHSHIPHKPESKDGKTNPRDPRVEEGDTCG